MSWDGDQYQARFDALASSGQDVHGEAHAVRRLQPSSVLDAGCGTGRVAIELARHGIEVVGVDADASMIVTAQKRAPGLRWVEADVASVDLERTFDVVVMAGNVPLFTPPGTQAQLVAGCARHLDAGGKLLAGFQLGRGYDIDQYDADCAAVGLHLVDRWSTWDRAPFDPATQYAVSLHEKRD
jgi:2-polyprenyl-3-methyl-5-hydroxy-6-metoxy-1,4-benzoquinol methylase